MPPMVDYIPPMVDYIPPMVDYIPPTVDYIHGVGVITYIFLRKSLDSDFVALYTTLRIDLFSLLCYTILIGGDFMKRLKRLFNKNRELDSKPMRPMPSWDKIVELLYDKNLDSFRDEVINVLYSKDNAMRYVVLKDKK